MIPKINIAVPGKVPLNLDKSQAAPAQPETAKVNQETTGPGVPDYGDLYQLADDLSAVLAQFRRRADAEKRSLASSDPFERILEEDSEPKVDSLDVIARSSAMSKDVFYNFARSMFPDDSDLVMVLREIIKRRKLAKLDNLIFEELLEEVLENSDKKRCMAGVNIGLKARLFSRKMNVSPQALRNTYRDFIGSDDEEIFQYQRWVEQYGADRRTKVAEFIEVALMHDIKSHDPSCSRLEFGNLLGHMVNIKRLQASDLAFIKEFFLQNLHIALLENELLVCWFDCLQNPFKIKDEIEKNKLVGLAKTFFLPPEELRQKLLKGIRKIDAELFFDPDIKEILIESLLYFPKVKETDEENRSEE